MRHSLPKNLQFKVEPGSKKWVHCILMFRWRQCCGRCIICNIASVLAREYQHPSFKSENSRQKLISALSDKSGSLLYAQRRDPFIRDVRNYIADQAIMTRSSNHTSMRQVFYYLHHKHQPPECEYWLQMKWKCYLKRCPHVMGVCLDGELRTFNHVTKSFLRPVCIRCQSSTGKDPAPALLQYLPLCDKPKERVHIERFGELPCRQQLW